MTSFEKLGRAEGQREIVLRLLNRKVGPLTHELRTRVTALSPEMLLSLSEALLDFTEQADLRAWLDQQDARQAS
ncbi:MAG: hypothetical protein OHK0015_06670 [Chloroflexi bacterium OHK40]